MIVTDIEASIGNEIPDVEKVQDTVEKILIKEGHDTLAKAYILYREKRAQESLKEKR